MLRSLGRFLSLSLLSLPSVAQELAEERSCIDAQPWPEADALFRNDRHWIGADGAFSVDLGNDRTLWLFGDSWINPDGDGTRDGAWLVRNSVAIQDGADPSRATIDFYWGDESGSGAFLDATDGHWYWPGHGFRIRDRLLLFLNRMRAAPEDGLGFASAGWDAVFIENVDDAPSAWRIMRRHTGADHQGIQLGFASVLRWGEYLYVFGTPDPEKSHPVHVARWPIEALESGDLPAPEWWTGTETGWTSDVSSHQAQSIFEGGQSELTISYDEESGRFTAIQTVGFGPAYLAIRTAEDLTGPWTSPQPIYTPPEHDQENIMIYAGKAHPQLQGAEMVLTYVTNSFEFADHFSARSIYYPRFVRLSRCDRDERED